VATHVPKCYSVSMRMLGMDMRAGNCANETGVYGTEFKFQVLIHSVKQETYLCVSTSSFILDFMAAG
jgi:hypothetical protein